MPMKEKQKQRLRVFEMACLRKIEGVTRRDRIRNEEIFNKLNIRIGIVDTSRLFHILSTRQNERDRERQREK